MASAPAVMAQQVQTYYIDYGTQGLLWLEQMNPSRVLRPLDMMGARAGADGWGMGGACVSTAEGLDAVAWNPAGLGWLDRPAIAADMSLLGSSGSVSDYPGTFQIPRQPSLIVKNYKENLASGSRYNLLGAAKSTQVLGGRRLTGALSYRRYLDVTDPEQVVENMDLPGGGLPVTLALDNQENGGVNAAAGTVAFELVPGLASVGLNVNFLDGSLHAHQELTAATGGPQNSVGTQKVRFRYRGHSADLGMQVRRGDLGGLGFRYTPAYTVQVRDGSWYNLSLPDATGLIQYSESALIARYDMKVPALVSFGGWIRPNRVLRFSVGVDQQKWSSTKITYLDTFQGREQNPKLPLHDVTSFSVGGEARFLRLASIQLPIRVGYRRAPLSVADMDTMQARLHPTDPTKWANGEIKSTAYSLGFGFESGNLRYDVAYEILDYTLHKYYFESPQDPLVNKTSRVVTIDRRATALRFSATLSL